MAVELLHHRWSFLLLLPADLGGKRANVLMCLGGPHPAPFFPRFLRRTYESTDIGIHTAGIRLRE